MNNHQIEINEEIKVNDLKEENIILRQEMEFANSEEEENAICMAIQFNNELIADMGNINAMQNRIS